VRIAFIDFPLKINKTAALTGGYTFDNLNAHYGWIVVVREKDAKNRHSPQIYVI
jgi:hypothetical protein